jgi:hypothetical protein
MSDELISVSDAAKKLGVSARTVQRYCKQGILNHKWVHGTRHRELRIVPPIPLSLLPGVKRGSAPDGVDLVTRQEFEDLHAAFTREIARRDQHIERLEQEIARLTVGAGIPRPFPSNQAASKRSNRSSKSTSGSVRSNENSFSNSPAP